ncbi:MAG: hypothetical protein AABX54_05525 [Nanoarchaeota archaeon]
MANESVKLIPREIKEAGFPEARFLSEEEHARYKEAKGFSGKAADSLKVGRNGSNLWEVLLLNQIGIRTGTIPEIELAYENGLPLQGHYEDGTEVVLRSAGDSYKPNDYLARNLAEMLGIMEFGNPLVVKGLEVVADNKSQYGLSFKKTDKTQVIEVPDLNHKNHQRKFSRINPDYSIAFDDNGTRTLWTRDNGISRLYLLRDLDLDSRGEYLAGSNDDGRVVVVDSAEGAQKNIEGYLAQLKTEKERQLAEVERKYGDAMRVFKGN